MKKLRLNSGMKAEKTMNSYRLNPTENYVINLEDEMEFCNIYNASNSYVWFPQHLKNWHAWLFENGLV